MAIEIRPVPAEQHGEFIVPISTAFGQRIVPERVEATKRLPELTWRLAAFDGADLVGAAGAFAFTVTTPGGMVEAAGLTMVAVLPTHRRRGILTDMMRRHLDDAHAAGQPISVLWASEGNIYGRFGYGLASQCYAATIDRDRAAFAAPSPTTGRARLLDEADALATFPAVWERARPERPGMLSRSKEWWQLRRIAEGTWRQPAGGPLQRVLIEVDGRPEAYALYVLSHEWDRASIPVGALHVVEALGATPLGTRLIWRYLLDVDLVPRVEASLLPIDHPLILLMAEPRRLRLGLTDAVWVRIVDVEAALAARGYGSDGALVLEIDDALCPRNQGRYRLDGGARRVARTTADPDLRLDITELGAAYLGGISFQRLADAGRVEAMTRGAIERADALFRSARAPWCPEIF